MSTMVERVARAICESLESDIYDELQERSIVKAAYLQQARAAIEAMSLEDLKLETAKRKFDLQCKTLANGCIEWTGAVDRRDGYGRFYDGSGNTRTAYGFAWSYYCGEVPKDMVLDHECRNRKCVNVDHLRPVSNTFNVMSGVGVTAINAWKTHCKRGHPLDGENLYVTPTGGRDCRTCRQQSSQRYKERKRQAALKEQA